MRRGYTKTRVIFFNAPSAAHWGRPVGNRRRVNIWCLMVLSLFAFVMAVFIYTRFSPILHADGYWTTGQRLRLTAVHSGDGLRVTWFSELNTRERLQSALATTSTDPLMFEADVGSLSYDDTVPVKERLMMAVTREVKGDITLEDWLDDVIASRKGGFKLNFIIPDSLEKALQLLRDRKQELLHVPVWLTVKVVKGPGATDNVIDATWVTRMVNSTYPRAQMVFEWALTCCGRDNDVTFGRGSMENMLKVCQHTRQPIIVSARVTHAASQWRHFRWLLESSDRLSLLLRSPEEDKMWRNDSSFYDLLTIRNDWNKMRIFYDLPETRLNYFRQLAETAGSPLHYFDIRDMDASRVTWAHGANTETALEQAGVGQINMLEGDVSLEGQGTPRQTNTPVMAHRGHRHKTNSSLTLKAWLAKVLTTNKAIKLDIKSPEAVVPTLMILAKNRLQLRRPVWLNGDILRGPNALHDPTNTTHFLRSVNTIFPEVTLSLGWTSGWVDGQDNEAYSWEMVEKMEKVAKRLRQPVNFAVRAVLARNSWDKFDWLLHQSRRYTLTLWCSPTSSDKLVIADMDYIRHQSERSRIYFDIPHDVIPNVYTV